MPSTPNISIVIPTYNRKALIVGCLESAFAFCEGLDAYEILVVDDASTDGTLEHVEAEFGPYVRAGLLKLHRLPENRGVTGSKNAGALMANGKWLLFLDSDDLLIAQASTAMMKTLEHFTDRSIVFFRCHELGGGAIGPPQAETIELDLKALLRHGTPGECLPVVRRDRFAQVRYREDLRGFESLTYLQLVKRFGPLIVSPIVARWYRVDNSDRLSVGAGFRQRLSLLARGNTALLKEHGQNLGWLGIAQVSARIVYYTVWHHYQRLFPQ